MNIQSIGAAQKQRQESAHKIKCLEAECQKLRTMVQKRLPGPAVLVKMKNELPVLLKMEREGHAQVQQCSHH
jgi:hypothetical protein